MAGMQNVHEALAALPSLPPKVYAAQSNPPLPAVAHPVSSRAPIQIEKPDVP